MAINTSALNVRQLLPDSRLLYPSDASSCFVWKPESTSTSFNNRRFRIAPRFADFAYGMHFTITVVAQAPYSLGSVIATNPIRDKAYASVTTGVCGNKTIQELINYDEWSAWFNTQNFPCALNPALTYEMRVIKTPAGKFVRFEVLDCEPGNIRDWEPYDPWKDKTVPHGTPGSDVSYAAFYTGWSSRAGYPPLGYAIISASGPATSTTWGTPPQPIAFSSAVYPIVSTDAVYIPGAAVPNVISGAYRTTIKVSVNNTPGVECTLIGDPSANRWADWQTGVAGNSFYTSPVIMVTADADVSLPAFGESSALQCEIETSAGSGVFTRIKPWTATPQAQLPFPQLTGAAYPAITNTAGTAYAWHIPRLAYLASDLSGTELPDAYLVYVMQGTENVARFAGLDRLWRAMPANSGFANQSPLRAARYAWGMTIPLPDPTAANSLFVLNLGNHATQHPDTSTVAETGVSITGGTIAVPTATALPANANWRIIPTRAVLSTPPPSTETNVISVIRYPSPGERLGSGSHA